VSSPRLLKIDESLIDEYLSLEKSDLCFFLGEYAARQGYQFSEMNQLVYNLKKPLSVIDQPHWSYKEKSINQIADLIISLKAWQKLKDCLWIPIPPSKVTSHKEYDNRLTKVLIKIKEKEPNFSFSEILVSKENRDSAHLGAKRLGITEHINNLSIDQSKIISTQKPIIIFDDVITSGASFKAAQILLKKIYPDSTIVGFFVARSIKID